MITSLHQLHQNSFFVLSITIASTGSSPPPSTKSSVRVSKE
ncbi:hypothetical protein CAEBREN_13563 [Caenorhabditis brenneri]|uniref:Uncharacterized protein n=1 Tax=Caenorhabditis brenneri TaxID=135651 RepID=G0P5L3_CAEBE|nr:hypothetical protein CAEBREN_13563 [Caenorhabditis brenneri]